MASVWTKSYELKRGGRSYSIYYKDPATGETRHYMTLRKKTIADQKANELKTFIDSGKWPEIEKGKKKFRPLTLRDCSDAYIKKRNYLQNEGCRFGTKRHSLSTIPPTGVL